MKRITSIKRETFNPNKDKKVVILHLQNKIAFLYSHDVDEYIPTPCTEFKHINIPTEDCQSDFQRWEGIGYELFSINQTEFEKLAAAMITCKTAEQFWSILIDGLGLT